ncbi:hypothetical protein CENSYa_0682 [Cenarchaeum symbiosum A]|uniref:Uncharacterized protein n=1 Tax=Cenarchaeum symbiosum (strain A) TaxID=414004 RepID=A0RVE8_CENSY|nr:hypothetical protein CENSYa_0682 [Cenarchaeum symbiosum A]
MEIPAAGPVLPGECPLPAFIFAGALPGSAAARHCLSDMHDASRISACVELYNPSSFSPSACFLVLLIFAIMVSILSRMTEFSGSFGSTLSIISWIFFTGSWRSRLIFASFWPSSFSLFRMRIISSMFLLIMGSSSSVLARISLRFSPVSISVVSGRYCL